MLGLLSRSWWALIFRGVIAIIVGLAAFALPTITVGTLVMLFGIYAIFDGSLALTSAFTKSAIHSSRFQTETLPLPESRWALFAEGLIGLTFGVYALAWPAATGLFLVNFIAAWAVITGIFEMIYAVRLRREIANEWTLIMSGVMSLLIGLGMLFVPAAGLLMFAWMFGGYAIVTGILLVSFGIRMHAHHVHMVTPRSSDHRFAYR